MTRPTRRAGLLAGAATALLGAAIVFRITPLITMASALLALPALAFLQVRASAGRAGVVRRIDRPRVLEGDALGVRLEIVASWRAGVDVSIVEPLAGRPLEVPAGRGRHVVALEVRPGRRGRRRIAPPRLELGDPLGLARARPPAEGPEAELVVLPRLAPVHRRAPGAERAVRAGVARRAPGDGLQTPEIDGLAPWRPGTPASRIHWPALARGAGLLERRLVAERGDRPLIVLDTRTAAGPADGGVAGDAAVRAAGSLLLELAGAGGASLLLPDHARPLRIGPDLTGWDAIHLRLALVPAGPAGPAPRLRALGRWAGPVFLVAAQAVPRAPAELLSVARGALVVVAPDADPGPAAEFEVAGLRARRVTGEGTWAA